MGTEQTQTAGAALDGLHSLKRPDCQHTQHLIPAMRDGPSSDVSLPYNFRLTYNCTRPV